MSTEEMIKNLLTGGYELCIADKAEIVAKLRAAEELAKACDDVANCPGVENLGVGLSGDFCDALGVYRAAGGGE